VLLRDTHAGEGPAEAPGGAGAGTPEGRVDAPEGAVDAPKGAPRPVDEGEAERILSAVASWTGEGGAAAVWMRRV
jgi:hypothetical protein